MDTKVNFTLVGLFVILLGATAIILILWLTTMQYSETYDTYLIYMHEEVSGLSVQSPVRYNGVKVGYVQSIELNPTDAQQVILVLKIEQGTPITTSTVSSLMSEGITGIDYIGLKALTAEAPLLVAKPGEKYPIIPAEPSLLVQLSTSLQEVTASIKKLSNSVNDVFNIPNRQAIGESLTNIAKITKTLEQNSNNVNETLTSLNALMKNGEKASKQLPEVMTQLSDMLVSMKQLARNFSTVGQNATTTLKNTELTVQNISQQLLPSAEQLLNQLNSMTNNLEQFSFELQRNPSVLIRGKYPPPAGPGEKQ